MEQTFIENKNDNNAVAESQTIIDNLHKKRNRYHDEYQQKVMAFLKRNKNEIYNNFVVELYIMSAVLFGMDEQVYSLDNNLSEANKIDFINNLNELGLQNDMVETMYKTQELDELLKQYSIDAITNEIIVKVLKRNAKNFVGVLLQFLNKRNAYRKNANNSLLDEVVFLKALLIKHLCTMQKLSEYRDLN
ncbi:PK interacting protein [Ectropis obliqua nucleopolyhedrovirus]|uniref:PK interacting protein n=1 Tax=Ectropis obliqua nucleopolyhedrovirus TaxID=59376 RepID=A0EZ07_9ABAC|nr:PK interacting protein [Ectropis obliqua nucleopolyhedrovirus]ABI35787.1 PK interacting protein [Ectropis obliqua nucleopolyhedrovirus]AGS47949.1 hypothetical protein wdlz-06GM114 [Ectropis obliqua nucleopolyhedrovirus]QWV59629.1 PK interacting protein [Ectropis obliqua nucleopolyhedrovirus]UYO72900.1 PK interacting protein [Ectropis obliqua nucleopolyhedrovirus]